MGSWFKHPPEKIDAEAESDASCARDNEAWAMLMSHLADVWIDPIGTLMQSAIQSASHLGFCRYGNEVLVYRVAGAPAQAEVLLVGCVMGAMQEGSLISEAMRRDAL
jgi:hypothetical protein